MDQNKKYQILKYASIFLLLIFSFFLWRSVDRAIFVKGASVWVAPIIWSSLFFITFSLATVLIKERSALLLALAASFFLSFFFSFAPLQLLLTLLAFLLVFMAEGRIREDFRERLKINLGKNIRSGSTLVIFALALAISSQYFFETKGVSMERLLPRLEIGKETNGLVLKLISGFLPQAEGLADDQLTVDQFLTEMYEKQRSSAPIEAQLKDLDAAQRMQIESMLEDSGKKQVLSEGKKRLSEIALREVKGEEKISDIFSEIVNKKINGYFMPSLGKGESSSLFSAIIAIVILFTATSLGSFLMLVWVPLIRLLFFILKQSGAISVALVPAEKEVIE